MVRWDVLYWFWFMGGPKLLDVAWFHSFASIPTLRQINRTDFEKDIHSTSAELTGSTRLINKKSEFFTCTFRMFETHVQTSNTNNLPINFVPWFFPNVFVLNFAKSWNFFYFFKGILDFRRSFISKLQSLQIYCRYILL